LEERYKPLTEGVKRMDVRYEEQPCGALGQDYSTIDGYTRLASQSRAMAVAEVFAG
jgi:hypothetical protein